MLRPDRIIRTGLSLTEVLVALFVMAIGMISLLTLFPVGAMQVGMAMRDNRCAQTAIQADGMMRLWWQTEVVEKLGNEDPMFYVMDNPNDPRNGLGANLTAVTRGGVPAALATTITDPSFPVMVDPIGWQARPGGGNTERAWVARSFGGNVPFLPRRTGRAIYGGAPNGPPLTLAFGACCLKDDLTFDQTGTPDTTASAVLKGGIARQGRYSWAAVIQRPNNYNRNVANLSILTFDSRTLGAVQAGSEQVYQTQLTPGSTRVTINNIQVNNPPPIKPGSWIMDGTIRGTIRNANFYRVQSIQGNDNAAATTWTLDLQTPIKAPSGTNPSATANYIGHIYMFRYLAEVFERPALTPSDYQQQNP